MESDLTWKHLSTFTNRIAARLTAVREGKIFAGDAERPVDEDGAAPATGKTPPLRSTANEGEGRRSIRIHDTAAPPPRTAETHPRCPTPCVSAGPLGW